MQAPKVLICDRDRKWSGDVRRRLGDAGIGVVLTPERAPNANAYAELISGPALVTMTSRVRRRPRLGGLLNFYERAA